MVKLYKGAWIVLVLLAALGCGSSPTEAPEALDSGVDSSVSAQEDTFSSLDTAQPEEDTTVEEDTASEDVSGADAPDLAQDVNVCRLGEQRCESERRNEYCDRGEWVPEPCRSQFVCLDGEGCVPLICAPGEPSGCNSEAELAVCNDTGTDVGFETCPEGLRCRYAGGEFQCTDTVCDAGEVRCFDARQLEVCDDDGQGWSVSTSCLTNELCEDSACLSLCEINNKVSSFLGCEYWSVDLDNIERAQTSPHAVILSNPTDVAARVSVFYPNGEQMMVDEWPTVVEPGGLATWRFDPAWTDAVTGESIINARAIDGSVIDRQGYRFVTDVPVTTHQFNPLVNENVFTNDASLLFPSNALGNAYLVMSWKHGLSFSVLRGFLTVIAVDEAPTLVQITPTANVISGVDRSGLGRDMSGLNRGELREFVLERGEVLNLETLGTNGTDDLTGTVVVSDKPIAVFGGHECGNVQPEVQRCDHMESQLAPISTWGTFHVATKFESRGSEPDVWRVLASENGTRLTTSPPLTGVDGVTLSRGQFVEFEAFDHLIIQSSAPVSIGHYMVSANWPSIPLICNDSTGITGIGDPALTILPPLSQFRDNYIVLTPEGYDENYLNIIVEAGTVVELDGEVVAPEMFSAIAESGYEVAVLDVAAGPHTVLSDRRFGLEVYGYGCHVSYAYPGGMNLEVLNE